jgi:hypothetical protein
MAENEKNIVKKGGKQPPTPPPRPQSQKGPMPNQSR